MRSVPKRARSRRCSGCGEVPKPDQAYCRACHAQYMQEWRVRRNLTSERQRRLHRARASISRETGETPQATPARIAAAGSTK